MIDRGKKNIMGILIDAVDYEAAVARVVAAAKEHRPYTVSALAVHGVMTGVESKEHQYRLNSFDLLVPDGQPVRWALNLLHGTKLRNRVYGPDLTLHLLGAAEREGLPVYFYGSTEATLEGLRKSLAKRFPNLVVAGAEPSKFRNLNPQERQELAQRVSASGARITFIGLGCPRQEVFAYEMRDYISTPLIAVGAAFPFIAGELPQAPPTLQKYGLEWLFRLKTEPKRLWKRYLILNPYYLTLLASQALGRRFSALGSQPTRDIIYG